MNCIHLAHQHKGEIVNFRLHIYCIRIGHFQPIERTIGDLRCQDVVGIGRQYEGHTLILSLNPYGCGPVIFHEARPVQISTKRDQRHSLVIQLDIHFDKFRQLVD